MTVEMPKVNGFAVAGDELLVGGVPLGRLAARVGQTPFYAYDRALIDARVASLRRHLPPSVHLSYAVKANPMPALVQHLAGRVDGFDLASAGEMKVALDTPMPAGRISFAGPGKTEAELRQAVAAGVTVHVESPRELEILVTAGEDLGQRPRVSVRINPDFQVRGSGMHMGGGARQFGIDAELVPTVLRWIAALDLEFRGFHLYWGSQALNAEIVHEAQDRCVALALSLADHAPAPPALVNIGGGFGIPYTAKDRPLDLAAVGTGLGPLAERLERSLPEARLVVELGRYVVGEAGIYVCRVLDRKISRGQVFLVTDGGLHHHLAASGNFGQTIRRNFPLVVGTRMAEAPAETASVVGCLCTPLDLLGDRVALPAAGPGDLVVIFQSGAYGLSASPTAFLSHPAPVEVVA